MMTEMMTTNSPVTNDTNDTGGGGDSRFTGTQIFTCVIACIGLCGNANVVFLLAKNSRLQKKIMNIWIISQVRDL